jgi:hypothetical protein
VARNIGIPAGKGGSEREGVGEPGMGWILLNKAGLNEYWIAKLGRFAEI